MEHPSASLQAILMVEVGGRSGDRPGAGVGEGPPNSRSETPGLVAARARTRRSRAPRAVCERGQRRRERETVPERLVEASRGRGSRHAGRPFAAAPTAPSACRAGTSPRRCPRPSAVLDRVHQHAGHPDQQPVDHEGRRRPRRARRACGASSVERPRGREVISSVSGIGSARPAASRRPG